jgi:hypothetical protein
MPKWCVSFNGEVEVEADTEDEAIEFAVSKLIDDGLNQLMCDAEKQEDEEAR